LPTYQPPNENIQHSVSYSMSWRFCECNVCLDCSWGCCFVS